MSISATLRCDCGEVRGVVAGASPKRANRVICYCDDCQAYLHQLGRGDLLDARGGTDIVGIPPASLSIVQGREHIAGLRLKPKGIYRWYAACCKTPIGNTVSPAIPFVGMVTHALESETQRADEVFGPLRGAVFGQYALGGTPQGTKGVNLRLMARSIRIILAWKLSGRTWPHPFFDRATRAPSFRVAVLSKNEREALRSLCGPDPSGRLQGQSKAAKS